MRAISTRHANLMCTFSMKIGGESHTRSQRSNLPDFRGDGGDVGDGDGDGDGSGGDAGDGGDGGCPSPPASRQAPLRSSQAPSKRPRCSESSAQERAARDNVQNAPHSSEIFINEDWDSTRRSAMLFTIFKTPRAGARFFQNFQDAPHGSATFLKFSSCSARKRDFDHQRTIWSRAV